MGTVLCASLDLSRLSQGRACPSHRAPLPANTAWPMSIGTSGCFISPDHCGTTLKGVEGETGASSKKPLAHVVEVSFTWGTRGPRGHNERKLLRCQKSLS